MSLNAIGILVPAIVFVAIWFPLIAHYYVPNIVITEDMIDSARRVPADSVLDEIERFFGSANKDRKKLIASAQMVLQGKVTFFDSPSFTIGFPFNAEDFDKGLPGRQLFFAEFSIPNLLLSAYEVSGRDDFLMAAKDVILGFASYECSAWLPKGFLWNDHAIAGRISVMAKFWKLYRNHPDYKPETARNLLQLAARSARLLAKPAHFTFATNHGIMQNLALWQICLAFPSLPNIDYYKQLAFERMRDQMHFYINDEGVVLEHSAIYQKTGLRFIGMAFRYLNLLDMPIPEDWKVKCQKAEAFYAQLLRPDGSLPMFGDTNNLGSDCGITKKNERLEHKKRWITKRPYSLYPVAGYSIWWNGLDESPNEKQSNQTVVAWSYFPGHAHKHADEMSVLLWASGHSWWTNGGYWPYGAKGRAEAVSWAGSNAPHLTNESTHSIRHTRLISCARWDSLAAIDLERKGPDEYVARRQVIKIKPNLWIVLDHTFGKEGSRTTTTWTTSARVNLSKGELPGSYILETADRNKKLTKFILASKGAKISRFKGSFSPFAGWEGNRPASAIVIEQPANDSWAAAIWLLQESDGENQILNNTPFMENWKGPRNWQITLPLASGPMNIGRNDERIFFHTATETGIQKELQLSRPPQISDKVAEIHMAYENAAKRYPQKTYRVHRHLKATYVLITLFLVQESVFFIYRRYSGKYYMALRGMSAFGWIAVGTLLFGVYL